jgi:hypothetical protein
MNDPSRELGITVAIPEEKALGERRKFLKKAGKVALMAPAVALLLSAEKVRADSVPPLPSGAIGDSTVIRSDRRLKQYVKWVGALPNGLSLYSFQYIWGGPTFVGVMAQDVLGVMPDAVVTGLDGFYRVDYEMLGIRMLTLPQGHERHSIAA